ncbi:MAG: hypothetical protein ABIH99_01180 [Candidatus Micrarchaeota archaeon]
MKKILLALVLLFSFASISFALSEVGGACNLTGDCTSGYCTAKTCVAPDVGSVPLGVSCEATANCSIGYCQDGKCILPVGGTNILKPGIKSGCAGIVEGCVGGATCFALCNGIWVLLIALALVCGFVARNESMRLLPVISVLVPLIIGLLFAAFLGILASLIIIWLLLYRSGKKEEKEIKEEKKLAKDALEAAKKKLEGESGKPKLLS